MSDLGKIVEMGLHFREQSSYAKYLKENPERMADLATDLIAKNSLIVSECNDSLTGMLGFIIYPHFISGEMIAGEIFWWVEPEYRGTGLQLLKELERRAVAAGAKNIQMIAPTKQVGRVYRHLGFQEVETTWQKEIQQ